LNAPQPQPPTPNPRSGSPLDPECPPEAVKLAADAAAYLVIDTNVALHQLDFLEHPAVTDVIVTKTVLEEVRLIMPLFLRLLMSLLLVRLWGRWSRLHNHMVVAASGLAVESPLPPPPLPLPTQPLPLPTQRPTPPTQVEHRNRACFQRLRALTQSDTKRFYVFSNEHCRATYVEATQGESPNDRNDRAIRVVAKW